MPLTRAQEEQLQREQKDTPTEEVLSEQDFASNYLCASTLEHQGEAAAAPGAALSVYPPSGPLAILTCTSQLILC